MIEEEPAAVTKVPEADDVPERSEVPEPVENYQENVYNQPTQNHDQEAAMINGLEENTDVNDLNQKPPSPLTVEASNPADSSRRTPTPTDFAQVSNCKVFASKH